MEQNFQMVDVLDQAICVKNSNDFPITMTTNKDSRKYGLSGMKGQKIKEHKGQQSKTMEIQMKMVPIVKC